MKLLHWFLSLLAFLVGAAFIVGLVWVSDLKLDQLVSSLADVSPFAVLLLLVATGVHVALAGEKWRLVEARLGGETASRADAFAFSAIGVAVGQVLPTQVASSISRGLGNRYRRGRGGIRGAVASLWEQLFELLVVLVLVVPGIIVLRLNSPVLFLVLAPVALIAGALVLRPATSLARALARSDRSGRVRGFVRAAIQARLLDHDLSLRLYGLSVCRIGVLWIMAVAVTLAIHSPVPSLHFAVALPFVVIASVLSMLPAGIGANEWSFAGVLTLLGSPLGVAAAWVLVNRVLVAAASLLIGLFGLLLLGRPAGASPAAYGAGRNLAQSGS